MTGFLNDREEARGRPVGVAIDKTSTLLIAGNVIRLFLEALGASGLAAGSKHEHPL